LYGTPRYCSAVPITFVAAGAGRLAGLGDDAEPARTTEARMSPATLPADRLLIAG
jgi:hypothetical protein